MSTLLRYVGLLIVIVWLPFSIPLIIAGCLFRVSMASCLYGYEQTDALLFEIAKSYRRPTPTKGKES